jgi:hypothetical protein
MKKIAVLLIILIAMTQSAAAIGIGISPSEITINNALKGAEYERGFTVFNTGSEATNFSLSASGDLSDWVSFYAVNAPDISITAISIPGNDRASVIVKFQIPGDAANKNYTGALDVRSIPDATTAAGSQQAMIIGASSQVTIVVTGDQIIDGIVKAILIEDIESGYPLKISTRFQNTGNVAVKPGIAVNILKDGDIIHSFTHDSTKVKPATTETIIAEWSTTASNVPGDYTANVTVSLEGRTLKSDNPSFKILPVGTLTRQGNLTDMLIEGEPAVDTIVKVRAYFQNTGQIGTLAKFSGEVYKDSKLIDTLTSDELTVDKSKDAVLISYLKLASPGDYLVKGKVIYSGKETSLKEVSFRVSENKFAPGFEGIFAAIIVLALFLLNRKRR